MAEQATAPAVACNPKGLFDMRHKYWITGLGAAALFLGGFAYWAATAQSDTRNPFTDAQDTTTSPATLPGDSSTDQANPQQPLSPSDEDRLADRLAVELLERYGASIDQVQTQAGLLEERARIARDYPQHGPELFRRAIRLAFPDLADRILRLVAAMAEYQDWLAANQLALNDLPLLERQGRIWEKRQQLFGADAEALWADERAAFAQKQQAMQEVFARLDQSYDTTLDEKLFQLQEALDDTYGYGVERLAIDRGAVAQAYFGFDSVQARLRELPATERQEAINRSRRALGYTEAQIDRLAERDQKRNQRWDNGLGYMAEREALTGQFSGAELERRLDALRQERFAHEAKTIALEERDGFFRYQRPRIHGRN